MFLILRTNKSLLFSWISVLAAGMLLFFFFDTRAQTSQGSESEVFERPSSVEEAKEIPYVRIDQASVSESVYDEGERVSGAFSAVNDFGQYFSDMIYRVVVYEGIHDPVNDPLSTSLIYRDTLVDNLWKFDIGPESFKEILFSFQLPRNYPSGDYTFRITLYTPEGIAMGWHDAVAKISGSGAWLEADGGLYVKRGEFLASNSEGIQFVSDDPDPKGVITVINPTKKNVSAKTKIQVFERYFYGQLPLAEADGELTVYKSGSSIELTLQLPKITVPGSYVAILRFIDGDDERVSQPFFFRWVVTGISAEIEALVVKSNVIGKGQPIDVSMTVLGPADGSEISAGIARIIFKNEKGEEIGVFDKSFSLTAAPTLEQAMFVGAEPAEISFLDMRSGIRLAFTEVKAQVLSDGIILAEKSVTLPAPLPQSNLKFILWGAIGLIVLLALAVFVSKKFKNVPSANPLLILAFAASAVFIPWAAFAGNYCTPTFTCTEKDVVDPNAKDCVGIYNFYFDPLPGGIIAYGTSVTLKGSFTIGSNHCLNTANQTYVITFWRNGSPVGSQSGVYSAKDTETGPIYYNFSHIPSSGLNDYTVHVKVCKTTNCASGSPYDPVCHEEQLTRSVYVNSPPTVDAGSGHIWDIRDSSGNFVEHTHEGLLEDIDGNLQSFLVNWDACAYLECPNLNPSSGPASGANFLVPIKFSATTAGKFVLRLTAMDSIGETGQDTVVETVNQIPAKITNINTTCNGSVPGVTVRWSKYFSTNPDDHTVMVAVDKNQFDLSNGWWGYKSSQQPTTFVLGDAKPYIGGTPSIVGRTVTWTPWGPQSWSGLTAGQTYWVSLWNDTWSLDAVPFTVPACVGVNSSPIAEAGISLDGKNFSSSITVTKGESREIWLSAARDVNGDGQASSDPDGWNDPERGVSGGGKCEWNGDLAFGPFIPQSVYEAQNPSTPEACGTLVRDIPHTFDEAPGTYDISVLRITDKVGAESNVATVRVVIQSSGVGCVDECSAGAKRCRTVGTAQECGNFDGDPCLEWGNLSDCLLSGQICSGGTCVDRENLCGNGEVDPGEECDPGPSENLGGENCISRGFIGGGILSCRDDCSFNTIQCRRGWREI